MVELIREWMGYAERDYGVAKHLYEDYYPKPWEIICFHCQQAAEKAIKAVTILLRPEDNVPKVHDLPYLLDQIKNKTPIGEDLYQPADTITQYGVAFRYPNELFLEEQDAKKAIEYAKHVIDWAHSVIGSTDEMKCKEDNQNQ